MLDNEINLSYPNSKNLVKSDMQPQKWNVLVQKKDKT